MKNSARWLRTQIYFFKIHSKSDHFLPHSPIFYLYCCNKFLTDLFIFYSCPPTVYFSHNGQHDLSKMHLISHYFLTAIPLLASPLLVIKSKLLTTVCQAPCDLAPPTSLQPCLLPHSPCSLCSSLVGFAVLWTQETSSCLRAFTLSLLSACSGLSLDICMAVSHHSGLSSCSLYG